MVIYTKQPALIETYMDINIITIPFVEEVSFESRIFISDSYQVCLAKKLSNTICRDVLVLYKCNFVFILYLCYVAHAQYLRIIYSRCRYHYANRD